MKSFAPITLIFLAVLSVLTSCVKTNVTKEPVYVFASDATWPPMEFVDENGDIVGFDMDLLAAIAKEAEFEYEVRNTGWDGIFAGLANGSYDAVISSVTITDERKAAMDFSKPYVNAGQILVVPADYEGSEVLSDFAGKTVGSQQGTTGDFVIEDAEGVIRKAYDEVGLAIEDLANGNLDAVVCDSITAVDYVVGNEAYAGKLKIVGQPFTTEEFGIAVQKGNDELLELINVGLAAIIADGTRGKITEKWLR
ncbi:MAG: basic amino acid ABC transporter substrate-binding protein [Spirochaetales bacterium]|nr:basic amino acid ABC transporter substrate-binding protein [Spirochaetales bacterium]